MAGPSSILCFQCGVPLRFQAADTTLRVCNKCGATNFRNLRQGIENVYRPLEDHSLLKLGTTGKYDGLRFELIGRVQYHYEEGYTNFWLALWENQDTDWLAEWEGGYAWVEYMDTHNADSFLGLKPGQDGIRIGDLSYQVMRKSAQTMTCWEGELPGLKLDEQGFEAIELLAPADKTAKVHLYSSDLAEIFQGEFNYFQDFNFQGLRS